jgi:hypothetical protein
VLDAGGGGLPPQATATSESATTSEEAERMAAARITRAWPPQARDGPAARHFAQRKPMPEARTEDSRGIEETSAESDPSRPETAPVQTSRGNRGAIDPVEAALARALTEASAAGRWDVVAQLARELESRRTASAGNVVQLDAGKRRGR